MAGNRKTRALAPKQDKTVLAGAGDVISGLPLIGQQIARMPDPGGWGVGGPGARPAGGSVPSSNPFVIPKAAGISVMSQTFPSNYFVEWNITTWRYACNQVMQSGQTMSYATLTSWCYESSPFVQSLFEKLGEALDAIKFYAVDGKGERSDVLTQELCNKPWLMELRREILFSFFWGFSGLNFDPALERVYKYPMQEIDPINRFLKNSTYSYYDGDRFADSANLMFIQPSTNTERFLGLMQPITRAFILWNQSENNWVAAGRRLAFPVMTVGYPQNDGAIDLTSGNQINRFKVEAEQIAANIDPSKGFVFPYTLLPGGEIQKAIEIDFAETKAGQNMYKIYSEFSDDKKNEIRELVLGGTLSSSGSKSGSGSKSLGEVHERMFKQAVKSKLEFVLNVLNSEFVPKISKFYTNLPQGWKYEIDRTEQLTIDEITALSSAVTANGLRLTVPFFEANGIPKEYLEPAPAPVTPEKPVKDPDPNVNAAKKKAYW